MAKELRSAPFQMRMRPSVKAGGEKAAEARNISLSQLLESLLIEHLEREGYLQRKPRGGR
jgi:hypothetical protein